MKFTLKFSSDTPKTRGTKKHSAQTKVRKGESNKNPKNFGERLFLCDEIPQNKWIASLIGALCALFFSAFIYLEHFLGDSNAPIFSTICALCGIFLYFKLSRLGAFICGALIGILWFYWVGFSFRFFGIAYLIPLVWIVFALIYGGIFYLFCFFKSPIYRLFALTLSSWIHPFGFNWFILESMLSKSYFSPSKFTLFLLLIGVLIFSLMLTKKLYKAGVVWILSFYLILFGFQDSINWDSKPKPQTPTQLKIQTLSLNIPQNLRWDSKHLQTIIAQNYDKIRQAKAQNYDLVILPETAFPLALNLYPSLIESLKEASADIAILTGSLYQENHKIFNSAYLFQNGEMQVFHKQILVPFGEQIPLPHFLASWINKTFFEGAEDFEQAKLQSPNSTLIGNERFQIAICYEATREEFYQNSPQNLIAISNNAWFSPSIEPTLQKLLMLYFAKNYGTTIFHSSNASLDFTLKP
ncbi:apolipoprotein N-acyltransferase [Helicobacter sp. MIT 05-5294]|uniref:apolipoprotein N-acyltransferase n=1 Tax=Helicobacter sp. MIT 05-5294 TaxID=1548150 RepID=UPI001EE9ACA3|nr:apolipoprotein N-acyltransferase [Helicobacter sp. MIT 05-5294]